MHRILLGLVVAVLAGPGVAQAAPGQTPGPGETPAPGHTPGQTPAASANHAPVCPTEAHIRLPQNTAMYAENEIRTTVYGNCSDPDGAEATAALTYNTPGVYYAQNVATFVDQSALAMQTITQVTLVPHPNFVGKDSFQYYALDADRQLRSNITTFYIDVVAGLKEASAVWTGTGSGDQLNGTEVADTINGLAGDDVVVSAGGDDILNGGAGSDSLNAGPGNDVINDTTSAGTARAVVSAKKKPKPAKFVNVVDAGAGNDRINVRNHRRDNVKCGTGKDRVVADKNDKLSNCENVRRKK